MADISKTVAIIFEGNSQDAQKAVDDLTKSLETVGSGNTKAALDETNKGIASVGEQAKATTPSTEALASGLRKLAADAGAPEPVLSALDKVLLRIGAPGAGSAVLAASAIAAFAIIFARTGSDARDFTIALENVSGGAIDSGRALEFVAEASRKIEIDLNEALTQYQGFLTALDGTGVSAQTAENAFAGIAKAIQAVGGDGGDAQRALDAFVKIARDGKIDVKDLGSTIQAIPGGLRALSEALGVPIDDVRLLAKESALGREAIDLFAETLNNKTYDAGNISPVSDAITDLLNLFKRFALDLGAADGISLGLFVVEKAIRGITLVATIGVESLRFWGETLANIAYTLSSGDIAGFTDRLAESTGRYETNIQGAADKLLGLESTLKNTAAGPASSAYADLAAKLKDTGDSADKAASKTGDVDKAAKDAAKSALDWEREENKKNATLQKSAETAQKAEEAVLKYAAELAKLASNERIKLIEARVQLNVAELENQTKRVIAAFESVDNTINSTGKLIGDLFGQFGGVAQIDSSVRNALFAQLDIENKLRQQAADQQKKLIDAQIKQLESQTRKFESGDALIKIDGAGLEPHIEAFMWEILKKIQVRVNQDGLKLLLGV